eukprot:PhF_6_TR42135/c0_g1_i1/m.63644
MGQRCLEGHSTNPAQPNLCLVYLHTGTFCVHCKPPREMLRAPYNPEKHWISDRLFTTTAAAGSLDPSNNRMVPLLSEPSLFPVITPMMPSLKESNRHPPLTHSHKLHKLRAQYVCHMRQLKGLRDGKSSSFITTDPDPENYKKSQVAWAEVGHEAQQWKINGIQSNKDLHSLHRLSTEGGVVDFSKDIRSYNAGMYASILKSLSKRALGALALTTNDLLAEVCRDVGLLTIESQGFLRPYIDDVLSIILTRNPNCLTIGHQIEGLKLLLVGSDGSLGSGDASMTRRIWRHQGSRIQLKHSDVHPLCEGLGPCLRGPGVMTTVSADDITSQVFPTKTEMMQRKRVRNTST